MSNFATKLISSENNISLPESVNVFEKEKKTDNEFLKKDFSFKEWDYKITLTKAVDFDTNFINLHHSL